MFSILIRRNSLVFNQALLLFRSAGVETGRVFASTSWPNLAKMPLAKAARGVKSTKKVAEKKVESVETLAASIANEDQSETLSNGPAKKRQKTGLNTEVTTKETKKSKESGDEETSDKKDTPSVTYSSDKFKNPSNGKEWNFKISSWNINGIRAWLDKGGLDYIKAEDPDIFCCQELKCDKSKIPPRAELPNYHCYWLSGDTQGYSGVGLMSKVKPIKVTFGIENKKFDDEGRVITAEYDKFYLINSYIPNSGRGLVRLSYRQEWEKAFLSYMDSLEKEKPVIWCGDLNVAHNPIDLKNPTTNTKTAGFTKEERECFTNLLSHGYFDSFRSLYPTQTDAYTFWSYLRQSRDKNIGWRLDYYVMSEKLKDYLVDNVIRSQVIGSDHCPIVLYLKI